jgi:TIGR03118 family protein
MKTITTSLKTAALVAAALLVTAASAWATGFDWDNLQSDIHGVAELTDSHVVNPWGMARSNWSTIFVVDNGTGVATEYFQNGTPAPSFGNPRVITIPRSALNTEGANPTDTLWNNTSFFRVTNGTNRLPAQLIFVSEDGMISGWNPNLNNTHAFRALDRGATGAIYKGVALGVTNNHNFLYVTNFHSGHVETYNENFVLQTGFPFADPNIPAGYAPFGIRNFNGSVVVTYAKQDAEREDDVPCPGCGFIDVFNPHGQMLRRLVSRGNLNAPWGLELVNGQLWVGNFGDGRINVYEPSNGSFIGRPRDVFNIPLQFEGLWGLELVGGGLYFTAGIADEEHGIFGVISSAD